MFQAKYAPTSWMRAENAQANFVNESLEKQDEPLDLALVLLPESNVARDNSLSTVNVYVRETRIRLTP